MKLEVGQHQGRLEFVVVATWPSHGLAIRRYGLSGSTDDELLFSLVDVRHSPTKILSSLFLESRNPSRKTYSWNAEYAPYWQWLLVHLDIPFPPEFELESETVFGGELLMDSEVVEIYRILGAGLPFVWPRSEFVAWVEQQLSEGG